MHTYKAGDLVQLAWGDAPEYFDRGVAYPVSLEPWGEPVVRDSEGHGWAIGGFHQFEPYPVPAQGTHCTAPYVDPVLEYLKERARELLASPGDMPDVQVGRQAEVSAALRALYGVEPLVTLKTVVEFVPIQVEF